MEKGVETTPNNRVMQPILRQRSAFIHAGSTPMPALTLIFPDDSLRAILPMLDRQVLVLNRLWQAVNVCTVRRAFTLLCQGHAEVVYADAANNFLTHDFSSWREFSEREPEPEMVHTISF